MLCASPQRARNRRELERVLKREENTHRATFVYIENEQIKKSEKVFRNETIRKREKDKKS